MRAAAAALLLLGSAAATPGKGPAGACPYRKAASGDGGDVTVRNCTCTSNCAATVDFDESIYDWCYTADNCGTKAISRLGKYYDYCVYPPDQSYESQGRGAKMTKLWADVTKDPSGGSYPSGASLAGLFTESMKTSFEDNSDVFPAGRTKYIHSVGSVCKASFKATPGSKYTGVFQGADNILIRFSSAKDLDLDKPSMTPGFGIKFLIDGRQSSNFVAMPSLDGQADFNFFALNFTNHPAFPNDPSLKIVAKKFSQASDCPLQVGLWRCATWTQDGKQVDTPVFPYIIQFKPTGKVTFPSAPYNRAKISELFRQIVAGTHLFQVYGLPSPTATAAEPMGDLYIESDGCVTSTFGDTQLLIKHDYKEDDFARRPDWLAAVQKMDVNKICGTGSVSSTPPNPEPQHG
eukprot:TRINITY_DN1080_c0_g1_i2.p1 TRINITY_DN1080_c0_g1~~TRINITY_DN1080_c0_g1_i2.p1  ORF type:complete len:431 (+),score=171.41 TRINITY_DN1080_c0_g1_i2:81-1295(+)